ncbi:hypothetical protein QCE63_32005 [Caballeronia sp. LZ065]|uniref:phage fiber-tail adaptor protein n=1 Tax=Caballeronia sp. LZ065 TaxID=3038571 RepID=UPI002861E8E7|nr:hypothetical protein [Caballeronia sp. LZ065]MDR5784045.1 hypothetical protein [Caballeronia sp. LZ065]
MAYSYIPGFSKDPAAVLDFSWDWTAWLGTDESIVEQEVAPAAGMNVDSSSIGNGIVVAWLSGGTVGNSYIVACAIKTSAGRIETRRIQISVQDR